MGKTIIEKVKDLLSKETTKTTKTEVQNLAKVLAINKWEVNVENETFAIGDKITVKYEDGESYALQDGEYELEDGKVIQIDSDGIIVMIDGKTETTTETETKTEATEEVKASEETKTEETKTTEEENTIENQIIGLSEAIAALTARVDKLEGVEETKTDVEASKVEASKVEASKEEAKPTELEVAMAKIKKLEAKLEQPVTEPVINEEATLSESASYAVKMEARLANQRKQLGLN